MNIRRARMVAGPSEGKAPGVGTSVDSSDTFLLEPLTDDDFDTLFAVAAIGVTRTAVSRSALLPYLTSPHVQARWVAAIALADMGEERALPTLDRMLGEFLPPNEPRDCYGGVIPFYDVRMSLPRRIWEWGPPEAAPVLRRGLIAALQAESSFLSPDFPRPTQPELGTEAEAATVTADGLAWHTYDSERTPLLDYQHQLVYGLGYLNALGAFAGLTLPADVYYTGALYDAGFIVTTASATGHAERFRLNIWRVHATCGFLEKRYTFAKRVYRFDDVPDFKDGTEHVLEEQFGLSSELRMEALRDYEAVGGRHRLTRYVKRQRVHRVDSNQ